MSADLRELATVHFIDQDADSEAGKRLRGALPFGKAANVCLDHLAPDRPAAACNG